LNIIIILYTSLLSSLEDKNIVNYYLGHWCNDGEHILIITPNNDWIMFIYLRISPLNYQIIGIILGTIIGIIIIINWDNK